MKFLRLIQQMQARRALPIFHLFKFTKMFQVCQQKYQKLLLAVEVFIFTRFLFFYNLCSYVAFFTVWFSSWLTLYPFYVEAMDFPTPQRVGAGSPILPCHSVVVGIRGQRVQVNVQNIWNIPSIRALDSTLPPLEPIKLNIPPKIIKITKEPTPTMADIRARNTMAITELNRMREVPTFLKLPYLPFFDYNLGNVVTIRRVSEIPSFEHITRNHRSLASITLDSALGAIPEWRLASLPYNAENQSYTCPALKPALVARDPDNGELVHWNSDLGRVVAKSVYLEIAFCNGPDGLPTQPAVYALRARGDWALFVNNRLNYLPIEVPSRVLESISIGSFGLEPGRGLEVADNLDDLQDSRALLWQRFPVYPDRNDPNVRFANYNSNDYNAMAAASFQDYEPLLQGVEEAVSVAETIKQEMIDHSRELSELTSQQQAAQKVINKLTKQHNALKEQSDLLQIQRKHLTKVCEENFQAKISAEEVLMNSTQDVAVSEEKLRLMDSATEEFTQAELALRKKQELLVAHMVAYETAQATYEANMATYDKTITAAQKCVIDCQETKTALLRAQAKAAELVQRIPQLRESVLPPNEQLIKIQAKLNNDWEQLRAAYQSSMIRAKEVRERTLEAILNAPTVAQRLRLAQGCLEAHKLSNAVAQRYFHETVTELDTLKFRPSGATDQESRKRHMVELTEQVAFFWKEMQHTQSLIQKTTTEIESLRDAGLEEEACRLAFNKTRSIAIARAELLTRVHMCLYPLAPTPIYPVPDLLAEPTTPSNPQSTPHPHPQGRHTFATRSNEYEAKGPQSTPHPHPQGRHTFATRSNDPRLPPT